MKIRFDEDASDVEGRPESSSTIATAVIAEGIIAQHQGTTPSDCTDDSDDDDAAPQAITFGAAKERVLVAHKTRQETIRKQREDARRVRREREEKRKEARGGNVAEDAVVVNATTAAVTADTCAGDAVDLNAPLPEALLAAAALPKDKSVATSRASTGHVRRNVNVTLSAAATESSKRKPRSKTMLGGKLRVVALQSTRAAPASISPAILAFKERHFRGDRVRRATDGKSMSWSDENVAFVELTSHYFTTTSVL